MINNHPFFCYNYNAMKKKLALLVVFLITSCSNNKREILNLTCQVPGYFYGDEFVLPMNTITSLRMYYQDEYDKTKDIYNEKVTSLSKMFDRYHQYDNINNLYTLNSSCGSDTFIEVDKELYDALKLGVELTVFTDGAFNIAMGTLIDLYAPHFDSEDGYIPDADTLNDIISGIPTASDIEDVIIFDDENKKVKLNKYNDNDVIISLGAIGKGYIMDRCYGTLKELDISAVIDAGQSTLAAINSFPASKDGKYKVSFRSPSISNTNEIMFQSKLDADFFISTSGDYEQCYFDKEGKLLSHILDATTGKSNHYYRSVTLVSNNSNSLAVLDALSTAIFNIDSLEKVEKMLEKAKEKYNLDSLYFLLATPVMLENNIIYDKYNLVVSQTFAYTIVTDFNENVVNVSFLNRF